MDQPRRLLSFEYIGLLGIILLVFCNIAVFYNLYNYLGTLGIPGDLRGLLIGVFSLISMPLFLFASPFINHRNAPILMLVGLFALASCGIAYLFVDTFWGMLVLRSLNGASMFCMSASSLALLVWVIPEEKSGQGFAFYSSAILIPYALVPMVIDALEPWISSPAHTYAVMAALLLPAAVVVLVVMKRQREQERGMEKPRMPSWAAIRGNITRGPVAVMLAAQCFYFMNFSGLFFLFKGFAVNIGLSNVGYFFGVQMLLMLAIRTLGSGVFDRINKGVLLDLSFFMTAMGYLALSFTTTTTPIIPIALLFGIGLGLGYPALNSLMFLYSEPRFRALNANLMMLALHMGYFIGPILGGSLVNHTGYTGFLLTWMALNLGALTFCALLLRDPNAVKRTKA
jgi:MFS family permease